MYCNNCMNEITEGTFCTHCMTDNCAESSSHHLKPGTVLNRKYIVGNAIGEGGFGITYIGRDTTLDIKVAIKEYYPNGYVNRTHEYSNEITATTQKQKEFFEKGKDRFLLEARSIAKFNQEKGIVDVHDYFEENGTAYIIMEYLDGVNLSQYIRENGTMDATQLFTLMKPVMQSLKNIHEKGVIHRDISPDNIMYLKDGTLKLMDFGSARYFNNQDNMLSVVLKMGYAPEEQYRKNGDQGPWTDVYGICATMYRCITGKVPEEALDRLHVDNIQTPSQLGVDIPKPLEVTLMYGLAVHKENRCQSMGELIELTDRAIKKGQTPQLKDQIPAEDIYRTRAADGDYKTQMADAVYNARESQYATNNYQQNYTQPESKNGGNGLFVALVVVIIVIIVAVFALCAYLVVGTGLFDKTEETIETQVATEMVTEAVTESPTQAPTQEPEYDVPNVVELHYEDAQDAIKEAGFKVKTKWTSSVDVDYGFVVNQSPPATSQAKKGETITIYVSETQLIDEGKIRYVNASSDLTMREKPDRSAKKITSLDYNTPVEYISTSGEFTYIEYKGDRGYVLSEFLSYEAYPEENTGTGNIVETYAYDEYATIYYCRASKDVTLRKGASVDSRKICMIDSGEAVEYLATDGDFFYVNYMGQKGYVLKKFFSTNPYAPLVYDEV